MLGLLQQAPFKEEIYSVYMGNITLYIMNL